MYAMGSIARAAGAARMVLCPYCQRLCIEKDDTQGYLCHLASCPKVPWESMPAYARNLAQDALHDAQMGEREPSHHGKRERVSAQAVNYCARGVDLSILDSILDRAEVATEEDIDSDGG